MARNQALVDYVRQTSWTGRKWTWTTDQMRVALHKLGVLTVAEIPIGSPADAELRQWVYEISRPHMLIFQAARIIQTGLAA